MPSDRLPSPGRKRHNGRVSGHCVRDSLNYSRWDLPSFLVRWRYALDTEI